MKISAKKFVIIFLVLAFDFQFITNSLLGPTVKFYPVDGNWYPGEQSPIAWKNTMSRVIYPVKFVLVGPLTFLAQEPDSAPPVILFFFFLYWTAMALVIYYLVYLFRRITKRRAA
ncbi:MAG: hypothetical protein ACTHLE_01380 [Agriterribacter sp.]